MKTVLDANVIVSGIARYDEGDSPPVLVVRAAVDGKYRLVLSEEILGEATFALSKRYYGARFGESDIAENFLKVRRAARVVKLSSRIHDVATHWQDDRVLETALVGRADYLVTGDKELLALDHPFAFRIIHPNAFLLLLEGDEGDR